MLHRQVCFLVLCALVVIAVGCGRDPNLPPLVPVTGTITLNGKPVEGASVSFIPVGTTRGNGATGYTKAEGKYELVAPGGDKGVPVGEYRVTVSKLVNPDGSPYSGESGLAPMDSPAKEVLPPRYCDFDQTVLKATVPEGGSDSLDFSL